MTSPAKRYELLDALRGVAALAVVLFHLSQVRLEPQYARHGYLAVDFFFVLSGFVVAHAYEGALLGRLNWGSFFVKRAIRLYPLAVLGALLGLVLLLAKWHSFPGKVDGLGAILLSGALNALILPTFFYHVGAERDLFPGNGPLWTLFFEMLANLVWAWLGVRMRTWGLVAVAALCAVSLAVLATIFGTANIGFDVRSLAGGLARVGFGFTVGVVIFRLQDRLRVPPVAGGSVILGVVLVAVLCCPWSGLAAGVPVGDLVAIFLVMPAIVVAGIGQDAAGWVSALLGRLSYPVYVLHFPVLLLASGLSQSWLAGVNHNLIAGSAMTVVVCLALGAVRFYDEPLRAALSRGLYGKLGRKKML